MVRQYAARRSLQLRELLLGELPKLGYEVGDELVVSIWEDDVLAAPSMQYWIPPKGEGLPIFEGFYKQFISGRTGSFAGSAPCRLPGRLHELALSQTQVLVRIFQELGYVGRCSFDLLVVGQSLESANLHFIECNGRWGGTSLPMTFLNQIFGNWHDHPYAVLCWRIGAGDELSFSQVFDALEGDLFDRRTMQGKYILIQPQRMKERGEVTAITLTDSWSTAENATLLDFPTHLAESLTQQQQRS